MKLLNKLEFDVKKSKFISYFYEINTIDDINIVLSEIKKDHKKASHLPYVYKINNLVKKSDDGEPNGTSGLPIYNVIEKKQLNNCLIIVVRYYGGIKLGAGGLFRAYSKSASEVTK